MRTLSLLRQLLPFPRLVIEKSRIDATQRLVVDVRARGRPRCPGCHRKAPIYDRRPPREWRHLDFGGRQVILRATTLRRVQCARCSTIRVEEVSWAAPDSDFTRPFEDQVAWLLQHCDKTTISQLMRIAWRTVGSIASRVVDRCRLPIDVDRLSALGVDEISFRKGHHYLTLVTDHGSGRVIWAREGRTAGTLAAFFAEIGHDACAKIRWVTIDMSAAYRKAIEEHLPNAQITYDRFHVQKLLSEAVDETRRALWRESKGTPEGDAMKRSRWPLLKRPWHLLPAQELKLQEIARTNRRLYSAYLLKEEFAMIYDSLAYPEQAQPAIESWLRSASRSRNSAFIRVAQTIRRHFDGILAFFKTGYTSGRCEGLNTKARLATRQAFGFHAASAVLAMIELRCGGIAIRLPRAA